MGSSRRRRGWRSSRRRRVWSLSGVHHVARYLREATMTPAGVKAPKPQQAALMYRSGVWVHMCERVELGEGEVSDERHEAQ